MEIRQYLELASKSSLNIISQCSPEETVTSEIFKLLTLPLNCGHFFLRSSERQFSTVSRPEHWSFCWANSQSQFHMGNPPCDVSCKSYVRRFYEWTYSAE